MTEKKTTTMQPIKFPSKYKDLTELFVAQRDEWTAFKGYSLPLRLVTICDIILKTDEIPEKAKHYVSILTNLENFTLQGDIKEIKIELEDIESFQHKISSYKTLFHGETKKIWRAGNDKSCPWFPLYSHDDIYNVLSCIVSADAVLVLCDLADIYS